MRSLLVFGALLTQAAAAAAAAAGNPGFNSCLSSYPMRHARLPRFDLVFLVDSTLPAMQYDATYNYLRAFGCTLTFHMQYGFNVTVVEYDDDGVDVRLVGANNRTHLFTELMRLQDNPTSKRDKNGPNGDLCNALSKLEAELDKEKATRINATKLLHTVLAAKPDCKLVDEWAAFKKAWGDGSETWSLLPIVPSDSSFDVDGIIDELVYNETRTKPFMSGKMSWDELASADDARFPNVGHTDWRLTALRATALQLVRDAAQRAHENYFSPTPPTAAPEPTTTAVNATTTEEPGSSSTWIWIVVGVGVLVLLIVIVLLLCFCRGQATPDEPVVKPQEAAAAAPAAGAAAAAATGAAASAETEPGEAPTQNDTSVAGGSVVSTQKKSSTLTRSNVEMTQRSANELDVPELAVTPVDAASEALQWSRSGSPSRY